MAIHYSAEGRLQVNFLYREPRDTGLSIEGIFRLVRESLKDRVDIKEFYCDAAVSRWQNIHRAGKLGGDINHITGDVNFLAIGLKGKKNVLTIHDLGYYENPVHSRLVKMLYRMFWFSLPLRNIDIVTVVSEFTKQKLMQYFKFPEERIRVIYDPVKPVFRYSQKKEISKLPVVLMMGTGKHKNLDGLIEASKGSNFHIDIIGWPSQEESDKLRKYGVSHRVYNKLSDEEVYNRYVACDILFNASHYEGFGMPIIEAQAVGRPVIASNFGAMKEVGEGSALLVDPMQPAAIRAAIESLTDKRRYDETVAKGLENVVKYNYRKIAEQYLAVYEELAQMKK